MVESDDGFDAFMTLEHVKELPRKVASSKSQVEDTTLLGNGQLDDDFYPISSVSEVISHANRHTGPRSVRTKIDCQSTYHRFKLEGEPVCFILDGLTLRKCTLDQKPNSYLNKKFREQEWKTVDGG